jgi:hypothetical protein
MHARFNFFRVQFGGVHISVQLRRKSGAIQIKQPVFPGDGGNAAVQTCREMIGWIVLR